jgi:hypothetical protein
MNVISSHQTESLKSHGLAGGFSNQNSMRGNNFGIRMDGNSQ